MITILQFGRFRVVLNLVFSCIIFMVLWLFLVDGIQNCKIFPHFFYSKRDIGKEMAGNCFNLLTNEVLTD